MTTHPLAETIRKKLLADEIRLPALPESVFKVKNILADEEKGASDIAKVIKSDQTLSTAIIRIANSSRFNTGNTKINNLPMAIQRLGGKRTFQLLIAVASKILLQVKNKSLQAIIRKSFQHSQLVAVASQEIARISRDPGAEEAFLAGLLHDIGIAAIVCAVPDELLKLSDEEQRFVLNNLHKEVGGRLLSSWGLPASLVDVASHHEIESSDRPGGNLIDYVDAGHFIVHSSGLSTASKNAYEDVDPMEYPPIMRLDLNEAKLISVEMEIEEAAEELNSAMDI